MDLSIKGDIVHLYIYDSVKKKRQNITIPVYIKKGVIQKHAQLRPEVGYL